MKFNTINYTNLLINAFAALILALDLDYLAPPEVVSTTAMMFRCFTDDNGRTAAEILEAAKVSLDEKFPAVSLSGFEVVSDGENGQTVQFILEHQRLWPTA